MDHPGLGQDRPDLRGGGPGRDLHRHVRAAMAARVDLPLGPDEPADDDGHEQRHDDQQRHQDRMSAPSPGAGAGAGGGGWCRARTTAPGRCSRGGRMSCCSLTGQPLRPLGARRSTQVCSSTAAALWSITPRWSRSRRPPARSAPAAATGRQPLVDGDDLDRDRCPDLRDLVEDGPGGRVRLRPDSESGSPIDDADRFVVGDQVGQGPVIARAGRRSGQDGRRRWPRVWPSR